MSNQKMKRGNKANKNIYFDNVLLEKSENLVEVAKINAINMIIPLRNDFSILEQVDDNYWDFILTVAGVFMAATRLNNLCLGNVLEEKLMDVVAERLDQWNPNGVRGFDDCKKLFESEFDRLTKAGHDPRFVASDAIGKWIVGNVLGRLPQTYKEFKLVRLTGVMVIHAFFDWWNK